jgi:hypothetical protein
VNSVTRLLIALYARLLRLYPATFYREFGGEMKAVFADALADTRSRGPLGLLSWCGREFVTLPRALAQAHWQALSGEETLMERLSPFTRRKAGVEPPGATPRAIWAGTLPFLLAGLLVVLQAFYYPGLVPGLSHNAQLDLALHALLLLGLGVGWAYRFPRWSYGYLGIILMSSLWLGGTATPGLQLFGYSFGREQWGLRGWLPLLALAMAMLLLTRSRQPLAQLVRGVREDWTRLSFALYGAVTWLMRIVFFDSKGWYNDSRYLLLNLLALTLLFSVGALLYMQQRQGWRRVLALQTALLLVFPLEWLATSMDGSFGPFPWTPTALGLYLLLIGLWVTPPLWPGLAQMMHGHLRGP